jgi:hypothetical protein
LGCADSVEEVVELISDVIDIHSRCEFEIRGFMSNSYDVVKQIPQELVSGKIFVVVVHSRSKE